MNWFLLLLCLAPLGCTATCIRDSDCMGASICSQNRCLLIVRGDAGRWSTTSPPSVPDDSSDLEGDPGELPTEDGGFAPTAESTGN